MTNEMTKMVYGYYNGVPYYDLTEWKYAIRGHRETANDDELIALAEKISMNWYSSGHHQDLSTYYMDNFDFSRHFTDKEMARLKQLQQKAREAIKKADEAREWQCVKTIYYADNSIVDVYVDKNGISEERIVTAPHGDACY